MHSPCFVDSAELKQGSFQRQTKKLTVVLGDEDRHTRAVIRGKVVI